MTINDLYDRTATLPEFGEFHASKPMAIADAFIALTDPERAKTDDELALLFDLAKSLAVWDFRGTRLEAVAYIAANIDPAPAPADEG